MCGVSDYGSLTKAGNLDAAAGAGNEHVARRQIAMRDPAHVQVEEAARNLECDYGSWRYRNQATIISVRNFWHTR